MLVTSEGNEEIVAQALRLGISDYLVKHPNYLYELPAILEKVHHQNILMRERIALQTAKRQYEELTARIPVGVYRFRMRCDGGAQFDYVSARWCLMNDLEMSAVLRNVKEASALIHPGIRANSSA